PRVPSRRALPPPPPPPPPRRGGGTKTRAPPPPPPPPLGGEGRGGGGRRRRALDDASICPAPTPTLPRTRGREQERVHENHPCSIQWPCSPGGAKTQARWPCEVSMT